MTAETRVQRGMLRSFARASDQVVNALETPVPRRDAAEHRNAERGFQRGKIDGEVVLLRLVQHVDQDADALPHVDELLREEQVPLEVHAIHHVQNGVGVDDDVASGGFLVVERRYAVDAGRVADGAIKVRGGGKFHRGAGKIGHIHVHPGKVVEHHGLADVRVPGKHDARPPRRGATIRMHWERMSPSGSR
jgi:hypothetical protein